MIEMKKIVAILAIFGLLSGCSQEESVSSTIMPQEEETQVEQEETSDKSNLFGNFSSETQAGEEISSDIFAEYQLTMVNVWATWCPPCVEEMPYLQTVWENLPETVNLITLCQDGDEKRERMEEILSLSEATFTTVLPSESLNQQVFPRISAFPTTVFVNSQGEVVTAFSGVPPGDVVQEYLNIIEEVLGMMEENPGN